MHTAEYWKAVDDDIVQCTLCPNNCKLQEGEQGVCRIRKAVNTSLTTEGYGQISSLHVDPIEKKPLARFHPGTMILSIGGWGCNLGCAFCQNWTISQDFKPSPTIISPTELASYAFNDNSIGIAYTYNEPLVNIEFVKDCAKLVREAGGKNVLVTNGYVHQKPADDILPILDAVNIDIKSINPEFYKAHCGGKLEPVLQFAKLALKHGCHVEITNLIIPGLNDDDDEFLELSKWIEENLGESTPLHLSAYHPQYKLNVEPTPLDTVRRAVKICSKRLRYIYPGNIGRKL